MPLVNMRGSCSQSQGQRGRGKGKGTPRIAALQSSTLCIQQEIANPLHALDPAEAVYKETGSPQLHTSPPTLRDCKPTCVSLCVLDCV